MAPSPEHDNEPKEPDKNDNKSTEGAIRTTTDFLDDHLSSSARDLDLQDSNVSTLDDTQLKALLDEAITYKTPKDREGKSRIFKVLLQEAEEDERNARAASASGPQLARYYNAAARRQRGQRRSDTSSAASVAVSTTQGGSLQDLVQAGLYEVERDERCGRGRRPGGSRRRHHHQHAVTGPRVSVSARQREGGSLPSNVNAGVLYPTDLRLFTDHKPHKPQSSAASTTSDSAMVESCTEASAPQSGEPVAGAQGPQKPEYTVIDLENAEDTETEKNEASVVEGAQLEVPATPEETRGLLQSNARNSSYCSTENLPRYRYHSSEASTGSLELQEIEKEEPAAETTSTGSGRRHHSTSAFDGVPRHQYFNPLEEALHHHRIPRIRYTSRATLEVDGVSGAHGTTTVDKGIAFPQFESGASSTGAAPLQLDPEYNSVRCIVEGTGGETASGGRSQSAAMVPTQYRLLSVANPKIIHGVDRFQHHTEKKGLDENGNVPQAATDSKKKKKCKVDRNVTVLKSEKLPGHRADIIENIDLLVKYIEEDDATASKTKHNHHHNHHKTPLTDKTKPLTMENTKKRRIKTKSEQSQSNSAVVKKSNSLEEISKTKLEDLMLEDPKRRVKKQSISEDGYNHEDFTPETDFHVVTKKKKSKKRKLQQPQTYYHYHRIDSGCPSVDSRSQVAPHPPRAEPQRRKSACSVPPSDKSGDSSDVDSVHSLPAATVHRADDTGAGGPQGSGQSSYADIARTNGGGSSASSNCSTQSGSSNQSAPPQMTPPGVVWKLSPQLPAPVGPVAPQPAPQNAVPPALHSEHFPELVSEKDNNPGALGALGAGQSVVETSPLRLDSDFPTLGGETPSNTKPKPQQNITQPPVGNSTNFVAQQGEQPLEAAQLLSPTVPTSGGPPSVATSPPKLPRQDINLKISDTRVENRTLSVKTRRAVSRPAVIILDEQNGERGPISGAPIQVSGLTFGFELNEQLLNDSDGESCETPPPRGPTAAAEAFTARFVAPQIGGPYTMNYNHDKIVTFVGLAWEDVVQQTNGKVQYYNGQ